MEALENEYQEVLNDNRKTLQGIKDASFNNVQDAIQKNKDKYLKLLKQSVPEEMISLPLIDIFKEQIEKINQYRLRIKTVEQSAKDCKEKITQCAQKAKAKAAYAILNDISIDELKKEMSGSIRLKPLKDCGFDTVADICGANVFELRSINGISDLTARSLKRVADIFANNVLRTTKFKISIDDQNPETTALLKQVYQYKYYYQEICDLPKLRQFDSTIDKSIKNLEEVGNGSTWLFLQDSEQETIKNAYAYLNSIIQGEYGKMVWNLKNLKEVPIKNDSVWNDFQENPIIYFNIIEEVCPGFLGNDDSHYGLPEDLAKQIQDEAFFPDGLNCTLRKYQEWGVKYILHQKRILLGDEMGLGKTIQAIATIVSLKNTGATHFLIICPASVLTNWLREITSKSKLRAIEIHGRDKKSALKYWVKNGGVAVTNFETTSSLKLDENFKYDFLVVDEAHYIKNVNTLRSANVRRLAQKTNRVLFMTGTPLENNVDEMISLIEVLQPKIADAVRGYTYMSMAEQFREAIAPVYYRRKREDVLTELPEKEEVEEWCDLKPEEKLAYEDSVMKRQFMEMRRVSWNVDDLSESSKADHLKTIVEQAKTENRKILVFSFFLSTLDKIADLFGKDSIGPITGKVPILQRQDLIDQFSKAPSGTILLAQIQSGGTGLNIQSASVVVICEPQIKPSIENQAISRAYRMGQTRNVLVYRLLCSNCIDERMVEKMKQKQLEFDAFADKSFAAENAEIDKETQNNIIQEEIDRINQEKSDFSQEQEVRKTPKTNIIPLSVTGRISQIVQPYGGFINPRSLHTITLGKGMDELNEKESLYPFQMGLLVDYMTRYRSGAKLEEAFEISLLGAERLSDSHFPLATDGRKASSLLAKIHDLDDKSIEAAARLTGFDVCYRNSILHYKSVDEILVDKDTIENARIMITRGVNFLNLYGPKTLDGFTFEGGYTNLVGSGDGDYLTKDSLWDFKVSKNPPTKENTLQILMYWRMGLHSIHNEFKAIKNIGIFNPRLNIAYYLKTDEINEDVIQLVDSEVIGYK